MQRFPKSLVPFVVVFIYVENNAVGLCDLLRGAYHPRAGPVDIILKSFEMCPKRLRGEDGLVFSNISTSSPEGRPYVFSLSADVKLDFPLDDSLLTELQLSQWTSRGTWKTGLVKDIKIPQTCSSLNVYAGKIYENFLVQLYGKRVACPAPPLEHGELRNITVNTKSIRFVREFVYGRWRCDLKLKHVPTGAVKTCFRLISELAPAVSQ